MSYIVYTYVRLQNFAYRVEPGLFSFIIASLIALLIALHTVGIRAYIAASTNPAEALRYE